MTARLTGPFRGARQAGCRTLLVRTGIFDEDNLSRSRARPELVIDSIADLTHV